MEVRPGYKQTEVGVIPEEWEVLPLEEIMNPKRPICYGIVQTGRSVNNGIRCVRVVDITNGRVDTNNLITTSPEISMAYKRTILSKGDLIIALRGKIGALAIIDEQLSGANLTRGVALLAPRDGYDSNYLCQALSSPRGKQVFEKNLNGSALQEIPIATLRKIPTAIPPLSEQQAIAAALSDVDALLAKLDQLIAKKRDLKQAAMQQLLTGQIRLPGFGNSAGKFKQTDIGRIPEEWDLKPLHEGIKLLSGHHVLAKYCNAEGKGTPYITGPADFPNGIITQSKFTEKPTTICRKDDILVTVKGSGAGTIILTDREYCISRQLMAIRSLEWNTVFIYVSLRRDSSLFGAAATGLIPGLSRRDILNKYIAIPPLPEQAAIATVLSDMDTEIAALEARRAKTRQLKQGMMQQLLTGAIRLI